jgi:hypothetical protein
MCRLTANGRQRFTQYISVLERIVTDAQPKTQPEEQRDTRTHPLETYRVDCCSPSAHILALRTSLPLTTVSPT